MNRSTEPRTTVVNYFQGVILYNAILPEVYCMSNHVWMRRLGFSYLIHSQPFYSCNAVLFPLHWKHIIPSCILFQFHLFGAFQYNQILLRLNMFNLGRKFHFRAKSFCWTSRCQNRFRKMNQLFHVLYGEPILARICLVVVISNFVCRFYWNEMNIVL